MQIVEPKVELWKQNNTIKHIAKCARVCYAFNKQGNEEVLCNRLWLNNHRSMFRHAGVYYIIDCKIEIPNEAYIGTKSIHLEDKTYISTNEQCAREYWDKRYKNYRIPLYEVVHNKVFKQYKLIRYTFCIETGIDITREFNRKSPNNIAEQSTRYVDFTKKVGIKFKQCHWMSKCNLYHTILYKFMLKCCEWFYKIARSKYGLDLLPEDARFILPLDIMSKVVYTYTVAEWEYIINTRLWNLTGKAHKDAQIIAQQIYDILTEEYYSITRFKTL